MLFHPAYNQLAAELVRETKRQWNEKNDQKLLATYRRKSEKISVMTETQYSR